MKPEYQDLVAEAFMSAIDRVVEDDPAGVRSRNYLVTTLIDAFPSRRVVAVDGDADAIVATVQSVAPKLDKRSLYELSYVVPLGGAAGMSRQVYMNALCKGTTIFVPYTQMIRNIADGMPAKEAVAIFSRDIELKQNLRINTGHLSLLNWAPPGLFEFFAGHLDPERNRIRRPSTMWDDIRDLSLRTIGALPRVEPLYHGGEDAPPMGDKGVDRVVRGTARLLSSNFPYLKEYHAALPDHLRHHVTDGMEDIELARKGLPLPDGTAKKMAWDSLLSPSTRLEVRWLKVPQVQLAIINDDELLTSLAHQVFVPFASPGRPRLVNVHGEKRPTRLTIFKQACDIDIDPGPVVHFYYLYSSFVEEMLMTKFVRSVYMKAVDEGLIENCMKDSAWASRYS